MSQSWPPEFEAPGTDLGQLQRGLGSVSRRAFGGEVDGLAEMVVACVAADPRWDQIDRRDDYYARLAIYAGIDPSVFEAMVLAEEGEEHESDPGASLALHVMSRMASLGDIAALDGARRYIGAGRYWDEVLSELADGPDQHPHPKWNERVGDLGPAVVARWATEAEMLEEIGWLWSADPSAPPWSALVAGQPAFRKALDDRARKLRREKKTGPWATLPGLSTTELLEQDDPTNVRRVFNALSSRTFTDGEMAHLTQVARDPSASMHPAAVGTLARLGRLDVLDATLDFPSSRAPGRALLFGAFRDMPLNATRQHAVEWLNGADDYRRRAAAAAFARHATQADLPLVRERLATEIALGTIGEQYVICDLASALGKHPGNGPYPELATAYEAMPYSFGRHFIVDAMAATDTSFASGIGIDCLWDTERTTRTAAAETVDRTHLIAATRIAQLRSDEDEDPDVRAAAA